ncbi:PRC and DUF2382 domain-containing protein [Kitasatospora cheerisanensis]|uniref:PRC and DUF2382 domain-containing protein n=3 Tax=Kitasatospora TaxID=2063 RepID=UPI0007C5B91B|nr:PRC and DUF2382 domain-containing protein [Kitasatospora cheerisanensis]
MQTDIDPRDLIGHKAVDRNGDKIGTVDEVYLDDATGEPEWAAVRTGIFGRDAFVPLTTSEFAGDELRVPYDKSLIKESPDFGVGQHLSPAQELQLYRYYGLDSSADDSAESVRPAPAPAPPASTTAAAGKGGPAADRDFGTVASSPDPVHRPAPTHTAPAAPAAFTPYTGPKESAPRDTAPKESESKESAPKEAAVPKDTAPKDTTPKDSAPKAEQKRSDGAAAQADRTPPVEITCREERLDVTTEWHPVGTARLRKYVTTEAVERRVPVVRERVRVERIPVSDAERAALSDQEIAEAVEEVTLHEERPVVRKYLAPVERVRLVVERYTEEEVIREELRREHVEVHDAADGADGRTQQRQPWNAQPQSPAAAHADQHPQPHRPSTPATPEAAGAAGAANGDGSGHARPEPMRSV